MITEYWIAYVKFRRGEKGSKQADGVRVMREEEFERRFSPHDREKMIAGECVHKIIKDDIYEAFKLQHKFEYNPVRIEE